MISWADPKRSLSQRETSWSRQEYHSSKSSSTSDTNTSHKIMTKVPRSSVWCPLKWIGLAWRRCMDSAPGERRCRESQAFTKDGWVTCYVPGTVLGVRDTTVHKIQWAPPCTEPSGHRRAHSHCWEHISERLLALFWFLTCYWYSKSVLWVPRQVVSDEWLDGSLRILATWIIIAARPQSG